MDVDHEELERIPHEAMSLSENIHKGPVVGLRLDFGFWVRQKPTTGNVLSELCIFAKMLWVSWVGGLFSNA